MLCVWQCQPDVGAEPALFAGTDDIGMVFVPEAGQGFHADAVARGIGRWQPVFVKYDRAIEAVLYENVQHIFLTNDEKRQDAPAFCLFFTGMDSVFNEIGKDHGQVRAEGRTAVRDIGLGRNGDTFAYGRTEISRKGGIDDRVFTILLPFGLIELQTYVFDQGQGFIIVVIRYEGCQFL